jgi:hypothetical protein
MKKLLLGCLMVLLTTTASAQPKKIIGTYWTHEFEKGCAWNSYETCQTWLIFREKGLAVWNRTDDGKCARLVDAVEWNGTTVQFDSTAWKLERLGNKLIVQFPHERVVYKRARMHPEFLCVGEKKT